MPTEYVILSFVKKNLAIAAFLFILSVGAYSFFDITSFIKTSEECANSISCIKNLEAEAETDSQAIFLGGTIDVPQIQLAQEIFEPTILGDVSNLAEKHIYVDLSAQKLYAYEGTQLFLETLVSTGKWGRTPTGDFQIWIKIRSTKMSGGSGSSYYYLPNVPYVMYFYNSEIPKARGYGLHGTYWHNNFGYEMSHGCVNLRNIDAKALYEWTTPTVIKPTTYATTQDPGTPLTICKSLEIREGELPVCLE